MVSRNDIKHFYNRIKQLLLYPGREWAIIRQEEDSSSRLFNLFFIPVTGIVSLVVIPGGIYRFGIFQGILYSLINFISATAGVYLAFLIIREYLNNKIPDAENTALHLTVYSASVFIVFHSLSVALINGFFSQLLSLISLIFIRTLYAGISAVTRLEVNQKTNTLIIAALSIICIPVIFKRFLMILFHIPILNL